MTDHETACRPFDVAIVGAGLAGASLALRLARDGVRVALLDASEFPRDKTCGEFLSPECWEAFDDLGLAEAVVRLAPEPIRRVRLSTPRGRAVVAAVVGPDGRAGIGLSRWALDDLLVATARAAGVTVCESTRVAAPIVEGGRCVGVQARSASFGPLAVRAAVTVAADGRQSGLVKLAGTTRGRSWFRPRLFGLKRHLDPSDPSDGEEPGTVGLHLVPGGYGGTCRIEGGRVNLCALLPEATVRLRRGDLDRVARECLGRNPALARLLDRSTPAGDWKAVAGVRVQVSRPTWPGLLFAGDCQGTVDPLGGQGMTMALLGAAEIVPFVKRGLVGAGDGAGITPAVQQAWAAAWHRRFDRRVLLCRAFHHFLVHPALTDAASAAGPAAARLLAACYGLTRDQGRARRGWRVRPRPVEKVVAGPVGVP